MLLDRFNDPTNRDEVAFNERMADTEPKNAGCVDHEGTATLRGFVMGYAERPMESATRICQDGNADCMCLKYTIDAVAVGWIPP